MSSWHRLLVTEIVKRTRDVLGDLTFTRLVWLTENFDRTVAPFLRGDLDKHLEGIISPMPFKEVDEEEYMMEREFAKPPEAP